MRDTQIRRGGARIWEGTPVATEPPGIGGPVLVGIVLDAILRPDTLDPGEPPLRGIRMPDIAPPAITLPQATFPPLPEPAAPELALPPTPDVVVVEAPRSTPPAPAPYTPPVPRSAQMGIGARKSILPALLGGLAAILRPIPRGSPALSTALAPFPTPAPLDPLTPPLPLPGTDPLTPPQPSTVGLPQPLAGGSLQLSAPTEQQTDRCRCKKCKEPKKRKKRPSSKVANVHPYSRRMSEYSLKNLKRE